MPPPNQITSKNLLLAAVPQEDLLCYFSELHPVSLSLRQVLYEAGAPLEHVYFIEQGVASVLTNMADGSTIEVGMIGMEGMVGVTALLGGNVSAQQVIVQVPGTAQRMSAALCKAAFD
jgi:CRP-like cAMP-binding protein